MSSPTANKRKGAQFEIDVLKYLRLRGWDVERLRLAGPQDEGDIAGLPPGTRHRWEYVIEVKNAARFTPGDWLNQAQIEAKNYQAKRDLTIEPFPVVVAKRRGKGVADAFVIMSLSDFTDLTA